MPIDGSLVAESPGAGQADAAPPAPGLTERRGAPRARVGRGPTVSPKVVWDLDLGAVIFAAPTVVSATGGATGALAPTPGAGAVAYVGTHAGRMVGVRVEGSGAGEIVLDMLVGGIIWHAAAWDEAGRIYFGADNDELYALQLSTGELAWSLRLGNCTPPRAPGPEGVRCDVDGGPTLGPQGELYVGADGLYRVSAEGEVQWRFPPVADRPFATHVYSTPLVTDDGMVVFGGYDGMLTAVAAVDGAPRWTLPIGADVDGSPVQAPDGTIYVGADDGRLYAVAPDGSLSWTFDTARDIRAAVGLAADGTIYVPSFDGSLTRLDAGGVAQWTLPTGGPVVGTPLVDHAGNVFVGSRGQRLFGIAAAGRVLWNVEFPADVDAGVALSPGGTLVVGCDDGHLRALR